MTQNEKFLKDAEKHVKEFESEFEVERLREAYMALENVELAQEQDSKVRDQSRKECLYLWLEIVELLDHHLDPKFDPEDVPENLVQPPPTSTGIVYPPGADPKVIDNYEARAEYEKAIIANNAKISSYRLQTQLSRLDEPITRRAEAFIRHSYTSAPGDQAELRTAIDMVIKDRQRKKNLLKLLASPSP